MKYKIEQYAKQLGAFETVTPINAAWYLENFLDKEVAPIFGGFPYFPDEEGYLTFQVPHWGGNNQVPFLGVCDDYGDIVQGIFLDPTRYKGRVIHGASDMRSFSQLVADFEEGMYQLVFPLVTDERVLLTIPQPPEGSLDFNQFYHRGRRSTPTELPSWRT